MIYCSLKKLRKLRERRYVAIREADEPIHHRAHQRAHEQLALHRIRSPNQHHLCMEGREVSLWVLHPLKVALGPTNVAGSTTSIIACKNGIGKSLGGVVCS